MNSKKDRLNKVIEQAIDGLKNDFKVANNGHYGGWHQFFGSFKIGNVATSQALVLLNEFEIEFNDKQKAIEFLLVNQLKSDNTINNGGWAFISNVPGVANTESTCWALQALSDEFEKNNKVITDGIEWLKSNFINDAKLSGWGPAKDCGVRVYSTCLALSTFYKLGLSETYEFRAAVDSLKRLQNDDGGWGDVSGSNSTLIHTAHSIITLINLGIAATSRVIELAVSWVIKTLEAKAYENGLHMGYSEMFDFIYPNGQEKAIQRIKFYHMPIPYAILALIKAGCKNNKLIHETIFVLIQSSDYGIWRHPLLVEKPLWAVYDVLILFKHFKNSSYYGSFNDYLPKNTSKRKFDVIIFTVVPVEFQTLNRILNFAPKGKKEDFTKKGFWYYEYILDRPGRGDLSCLITMIGSAGDISCYSACSTTFEEFDCDLALLCGIAAGNKEDIKKYSAVIAESIVAYEYQRLEEDKITYRPQYFSIDGYTKRLIDKKDFHLHEWTQLISEFVKKTEIQLEEVKDYSIGDTELKTGVIAAGAKLIADGETLEVLKENIPIGKGIIAAEMEGSGFAPCCKEYNKEWLVIRGISDFGEDDKNNKLNKKHQPLAVAAASATMVYYLKYLHRTFEERSY
jgi:nucleoside phosphorylase